VMGREAARRDCFKGNVSRAQKVVGIPLD
jgi:hypothetical protein